MYKEVSMQQVIKTLGEYIKEQYNAKLDKQENIFNSGITGFFSDL